MARDAADVCRWLLECKRLKSYLDTVCTECWNFADINDIVTYMPPFRGFVMIRRVDISEEKKRTFFKLLKPKRFHTTYDHSNLYSKLLERVRAYRKA